MKNKKELPAFDEWFKEKHGDTFESYFEHPFMTIQESFKALSKYTREYVSDIIKATHHQD